MIFDTSLELRIKYDKKESLSKSEITSLLKNSKLVQNLTKDINQNPLFLIWKLIALSEIPYSIQLPYTKKIVDLIIKNLGTSEGFSLTGNKENLLPCYNAILIKAFCKLGLQSNKIVKNAVNWIINYQAFHRNFNSDWKEAEILKHGGCLKSTPCYIGLAKSVIALHEYNKFESNKNLQLKLEEGTEYILQHHLFKRQSNGNPITKHILDLYFPENYNITILELLWFISETDKIKDTRVKDSIEYINEKRNKNKMWAVDYVYKSNGYISFDGKAKEGQWISYLINTIQTYYYA
ncbi:hypothetical protein LEP1GSC195_3805 [Leptospira wolbachii serovar Codice str. CDC]|uniref:Prenyltransferase-like protein n=1 Tax=Leptospira wolbachii serovar Codice str. CDC TaxID=1218599 RepID=R9A9L4_9LEPT|nr:hypothetical protein [Leptospira wolbachii]EOQ96910.1 hypothetical protein LEP1GSC195_3805 [Leptospira wolbachii serovar Codice str. CDC]